MSSRRKGQRTERKAKEWWEERGYKVAKTQSGGRYKKDKDFFHSFDLLCMKPEEKVKCVQCKTNRASEIQQFAEEIKDFVPKEHCDVYYMVWYDYKGWRVLEMDFEGSYTTFLDER